MCIIIVYAPKTIKHFWMYAKVRKCYINLVYNNNTTYARPIAMNICLDYLTYICTNYRSQAQSSVTSLCVYIYIVVNVECLHSTDYSITTNIQSRHSNIILYQCETTMIQSPQRACWLPFICKWDEIYYCKGSNGTVKRGLESLCCVEFKYIKGINSKRSGTADQWLHLFWDTHCWL